MFVMDLTMPARLAGRGNAAGEVVSLNWRRTSGFRTMPGGQPWCGGAQPARAVVPGAALGARLPMASTATRPGAVRLTRD